LAGEVGGAVVAEISLLRTAARVIEVRAHNRTLSFSDLFAAAVTHKHSLTSHYARPFISDTGINHSNTGGKPVTDTS
jgi:hypothetical protein